jgi:hypothetical protein
LKPGGIFIVEDTEFSYYEDQNTRQQQQQEQEQQQQPIHSLFSGSIISYFAPAIHLVNRYFWNQAYQHSELGKAGSYISMISYGENCILLTKKTIEEAEQLWREPVYRTAGKIYNYGKDHFFPSFIE